MNNTKNTMAQKTIDLLRRIQRQIDKTPEQFHMAMWEWEPEVWQSYAARNGWSSTASPSLFSNHQFKVPCGTTMCIGGWAAVLSGVSVTRSSGEVTFANILEIDPKESVRLFYFMNWPEPFKGEYVAAGRAGDHLAMVGVTNRRIDHFIATNGAE